MLVSAPARSADIIVLLVIMTKWLPTLFRWSHAKYIEKQLHDLKKDLRVHAQMQGIAKLDDNQIAELSKALVARSGRIQTQR